MHMKREFLRTHVFILMNIALNGTLERLSINFGIIAKNQINAIYENRKIGFIGTLLMVLFFIENGKKNIP